MGMFILVLTQLLLVGVCAYTTTTGMTSSSLPFRRSTVPLTFDTTASTLCTVTSTPTADLPPVLQQLVDERRVYEMNLGKAMDTLRHDYTVILTHTPGTFVFSSFP